MKTVTSIQVNISCKDRNFHLEILTLFQFRSGCRHGTRSGIGEIYEKHLGPVTGISTHYNQSSPDFGHLFLTSSIDWTIKLWSLKVS